MEKRYLISEASAKTGLEAHVLRYWEEELGLEIPRNELGHRYYTDEHLNILIKAKQLKNKGYQLKAIKSEICGTGEIIPINSSVPVHIVENSRDDRMEQFKSIIGNIVTQSLRENNDVLGDKVIKEMDYLLRMKEEAEEDRYKKLDETIRNCQRSNKEAAAGYEGKSRRKRRK